MDEELRSFRERMTIRIFESEKDELENIIKKVKDEHGYRKYESESHFIRCAIIKLIREEKPKIKCKRR